jgi:hypothetical protein
MSNHVETIEETDAECLLASGRMFIIAHCAVAQRF